MSEEEKQVNQFAMIWNYNAHIEHQHNYFGGKKDEMENDECCDLVDLTFFSMKKYGTIESQELLRRVLKSATPKMDVNSGRDWVAVYIAYHYAEGVVKVMKRQADFFRLL